MGPSYCPHLRLSFSLPLLQATLFGFCQRLLPPPSIFSIPGSRRAPAEMGGKGKGSPLRDQRAGNCFLARLTARTILGVIPRHVVHSSNKSNARSINPQSVSRQFRHCTYLLCLHHGQFLHSFRPYPFTGTSWSSVSIPLAVPSPSTL